MFALSSVYSTEGVDRANVRILDPLVLQYTAAGHNITISNAVLTDFESLFNEYNVLKYPKEQIPV